MIRSISKVRLVSLATELVALARKYAAATDRLHATPKAANACKEINKSKVWFSVDGARKTTREASQEVELCNAWFGFTALPPVERRLRSTKLLCDFVPSEGNRFDQTANFGRDHRSSLGMFLAFCQSRLSPSRR